MERLTRYIVLDTETTGLGRNDRVIEIAAVLVENGQVVDKRSQLINPGREIPPFITELTGITTEMVCGKPDISCVLPRFLEYCGDIPVVGHNIAFDERMLKQEGVRCNMPVCLNIGADTVTVAHKVVPRLPSYKLSVLVDTFSLSYPNTHRALADVYATWALYEHLMNLAEQ